MDRLVHDLNYLRLFELSDDWVQGIYYSEFLEFGEIPTDYERILENIEIRSVFRKIMNSVDEWINCNVTASEEKSWAPLSTEVNHQKLLALLAYYIDFGGKNVMSHEHRNTALLACRVYFKMLSIPGYKAYHIYHSQLFTQALGCLSYPKTLCENEDHYFNLNQLTREVNSVLKEVALFAYDLRAVVEALQLNPEDMNFEDILSNLLEFTGGAIVNKLDIDKIELVNISRVIYEMVDLLLCDANGEPNADAIQLLFKCLLPKLVAASTDNRSANNLVRASYVAYTGLVLSKYGKAALSGYITLLQHLCYTQDGLERAEVRSARVSLVVGLMSLLPQKSYRYIVRWILKLSVTAKVVHRHIALELLAQLLNNDAEESITPPPVPEQPLNPGDGSQEVTAMAVDESADSSEVQNRTNDQTKNQDASINNTVDNHPNSPQPGPSGSEKVIDDQAKSQEAENSNVADASASDLQNDEVPAPLSSPDSSVAGPSGNNLTDSGIQDPTIAFDSECEDYILSLISDGPLGEIPDISDIPAQIPELGDIEEFSMFSEISGQPDTSVEAGTNENAQEKNEKNSQSNLSTEVGTSETAEENAIKETPRKSTKAKPSRSSKKAKSPTNLVQNNEMASTQAASTDDENSQDTVFENPEQVSEEDIAGVLRQRQHTAPHAELLRAVYERVQDASSTLRARAIAILTDCLANTRQPVRAAVAELNGDGSVSRMMVVAARCVSDERAVVRRAAVSLAHRSLSTGPPPQAQDLGILVSLCRDASILVRSAAISALGELVSTRPSDEVFDAFLSGPMHQMSDPETKVQEQVVNLIQQVAFDKLQKYSSVAYENPLPWDFLAAITKHNMRRHLQKACGLLFKMSKCINHRIVDIVSTHLATRDDARDLQALVLLTSVARLVEYSDVAFLLDYYYQLANDMKDRDQRLMPLTIELLTLWSRFLNTDARTRLRDHLVARLATDCDHDGSRISCAVLASHLDPSNLQWANELLQLSEARALNGGGVSEWLRTADLSLVAPVPPSDTLLPQLLSALQQPPPEWSPACHGAAVVAAGRLCVRSRSAAAAAAPVLAAILHSAAHALPARVNALLTLADVCVRYTCIVEPLLDSVCACLSGATPPTLRRAATRSLTRLLLAGFLRLRAPLYYKYCALLADSDADVREPAEYYVTCCLTPDAIYLHFVECVVHYNSAKSESISFDARQLIYDVMLQRMSLVQKLNIQCRLAREVLEHAADMAEENNGKLTPEMSATLLDTITLLCGPRMKLPKKPQNQGDVADIDDLQERVTTNIVSHKMKRTVAEVLVPAVLRLFAQVRLGGGQLAAYLVRIANDLLVDYRQEIEELIDNDEDLVVRVQMFQETIGSPQTFGNSRNLVTSSAPPEPDTPHAPRRRAPRASGPPRKRALRI